MGITALMGKECTRDKTLVQTLQCPSCHSPQDLRRESLNPNNWALNHNHLKEDEIS